MARCWRAPRYVVRVEHIDGRRHERWTPLNLDFRLAEGGLDALPDMADRAISDMIADLQHELHRRAGTLHELGGWTPGKPSRAHARLSECKGDA